MLRTVQFNIRGRENQDFIIFLRVFAVRGSSLIGVELHRFIEHRTAVRKTSMTTQATQV